MKPTFVKLVLAISIDGRIALPHGGESHLGNKGDRKVLEEALAWSDATLMGGETLRIHKSTCLIHNQALLNERIEKKQEPQPTCIIISDKQNFSNDYLFFRQPVKRWIIGRSKSEVNEISLKGFDQKLKIQGNWQATLNMLSKEGISKIVLLGGAKLIGSMMEDDQIDELQLTITPKIIGGKYSWLPYNNFCIPKLLREENAWNINAVRQLEGNEILVKYSRNN